jgi:hypothetical protein
MNEIIAHKIESDSQIVYIYIYIYIYIYNKLISIHHMCVPMSK